MLRLSKVIQPTDFDPFQVLRTQLSQIENIFHLHLTLLGSSLGRGMHRSDFVGGAAAIRRYRVEQVTCIVLGSRGPIVIINALDHGARPR